MAVGAAVRASITNRAPEPTVDEGTSAGREPALHPVDRRQQHLRALAQEHTPVARPKSLISGKNVKIEWSANWDDDLGGSTA
ncbi:hypothetical protein, partial [Kribbella koreensis]|uniref:hypothetical protein n=1 Tax=Kribbella koreensis TaxID=57909 RepID=UPI0031E3BF1B